MIHRPNQVLVDIEECVKDLATHQQDTQKSKERKQILDWIPSNDYSGRQNALQRDIQEGTGRWFLDTYVFGIWLHHKGNILFCPGMPGAGKTHIASLVIKNLQCFHPFPSTPQLAYIYCDYTHQLTRETLLGSLLEQLARTMHPLPAQLKALYKKHQGHETEPSETELRDVLYEIISRSGRCFIIVDGLDECTDGEGTKKFLLETLTTLRKVSGASILTMTRDIWHIREHFRKEKCLEIEIQASDHDVGVYLHHRIPCVLPLLADDLGLCRQIEAVIRAAADGMYMIWSNFPSSHANPSLGFYSLCSMSTRSGERLTPRPFKMHLQKLNQVVALSALLTKRP
jgi:hypothetical protein